MPVSKYVISATSRDNDMGLPMDSALMTARHSFSSLRSALGSVAPEEDAGDWDRPLCSATQLPRSPGEARHAWGYRRTHSMNQATALSIDPPTVRFPWFCRIKAFFCPKAPQIAPLSFAERTIPPWCPYNAMSSQNDAESCE